MKSEKINQKLKRRQDMIDLIEKGFSIPKISKRLGVGKSTIYYHYNKLKGRKYPLIKIPNEDKVIGEFLGVFAGDGSFYYDKKIGHYTIKIHLHAIDDKKYSIYLKRLIKTHFNKKVRSYLVKEKGLVLVFYSKSIYEFIQEYLYIRGYKTLNVHIKKPINDLSNDFLIFFIKGLIDTDGHMNKYGQIVISLISKDMISQTSQILEKFGIQNKIYLRKKHPKWHQQYELKILKKNAQKYLKIIGFSNKRKIKNAEAEI